MFSKSSKGSSSQPSAPQDVNVAPSIISIDLRMVGDLHSEGEIHVDGVIEGDIRAKVLLVGETASIKGEIIAETVRVHGNVNGTIKSIAVSLAKTARVNGDILHENLSIEKGAFLEGHCKRLTDGTLLESSKISLMPPVKDTAKELPSPMKPVSSGAPSAASKGKAKATTTDEAKEAPTEE